MALGRADGSERERVAHNSDFLARATRRSRALRLEHDPQPGLKRLHARRRRGFFDADGFRLAGDPPYPDVLKGLRPFRLGRRSAQRTDLRRPAMSVPLRDGVFRGRRMPERGKSRFATVSNTYIRPGKQDGKRGRILGQRPLNDRKPPAGRRLAPLAGGGFCRT